MAIDGESITRQMLPIAASPVPNTSSATLPINPFPGCCNDSVLQVLADASGDPLKNDQSSVWWLFDPIVTGATLTLKKYINGTWTTQTTITDNTLGTYGAFGYFVNAEGQSLLSFQASWAAIRTTYGTGSYKFTCAYTVPIYGNQSVDSHEFCLRTYQSYYADGTVRLEYWLSGITGDTTDDTKIKDFGSLSIYNSLRLRGYFGYPKAGYTSDQMQLNSGKFLYVEDEQKPIYKMELLLIPAWIHEILRTDFMQADTLAITDYNAKNNLAFIQKYVRKESGYEPKWYELQSDFASVELSFSQQNNRFRKFRQ